ncbi:hypothetical protein QF000_007176 [Paraburkholderia atlantica]|uniref:hypothetical protein n=1 Tax=Paraburkholderia atlantica TaxID=2654982 RepID=UPI00158FDE46|nr:hypothetical protein [Paraburkholderia atlantica]MBB5415479.1 hypothetical protein [Paraburkholderia atlantica]
MTAPMAPVVTGRTVWKARASAEKAQVSCPETSVEPHCGNNYRTKCIKKFEILTDTI